ncbi:MAG: thioredoxin-disulfide reductase [Holosporales bacterium]|jgi:thioredoxin reductase (NADPH)|nr:thioredoxin-disulfide reductase [Holosporales bacterium]
MERSVDVIIVGSGPAGYTAAIYAARFGLETVLFTGAHVGGQLIQTTEVENYPGFPTPILGIDLMERMRQQAQNMGAEVIFEAILDVTCDAYPFVCRSEKGVYNARAVIIATGATAKWLGVPGEEEFRGYGVSACATCDGFFYKEKKVAVVGGGNTAVTDALFLSKHASHVTLIHRKNALRAEQVLQKRLFENPKISVLWNSVVKEICGGSEAQNSLAPKRVSRIIIKSQEESTALEVDGVFVAVGHAPQTSLFAGKLRLTDDGYIFTEANSTRTSVPGIFAAGDVADPAYKQAVTAAGMGCAAAIEVAEFLAANETQ